MSSYNSSSFGLLRPSTPPLSRRSADPIPSSPCMILDACDDLDVERSITPTQASPRRLSVPTLLATSPTPERPHLRRRRSSLSVQTNSLANIKSPQRTAGVAFQKQMLMSPNGCRARSGSLAEGVVGQGTNAAGSASVRVNRLRSGSLAGALRNRRLRVGPAPPPPTAPLPPIPSTFPSHSSNRPRSTTIDTVSPPTLTIRRPLFPSRRSQTADNYPLLTHDFADKLVNAMNSVSAEPSPVDMDRVFWANEAIDEEMKEN
ncbi:hypothetical protein JAAARDRAFT_66931 [Jaapia argillacea MUCL 33604]|uniref:Uncharacterized protein n=1 Tax=Jaapia argillacea MUCL 33604 TaxID=933084 RepID=A0A067Q4H1_9AGAM|nr:hypothetical protein JAAARDRAFT_66931 [Jaapia argillacea MUCL 33604]